MAKAKNFIKNGQDVIVENFSELAAVSIYTQYGDQVKISRKTINRFGESRATGTTEELIVPWNVELDNASRATGNTIDTISSSSAADTGIVEIEHMTLEFGVMVQGKQTVTLNGQNKVTLDTPCMRVTNMRGVAAGRVVVYEDTTISGGVPVDSNDISNQIMPAENASVSTFTSVQGSNYLVITELWASVDRLSLNRSVDFRLKVSNLGDEILGDGVYTVFKGAASGNGPLVKTFTPYLVIRPNSDIFMTAQTDSGNTDVSAGFSGFFADIIPPKNA